MDEKNNNNVQKPLTPHGEDPDVKIHLGVSSRWQMSALFVSAVSTHGSLE
jgi:hypothetical protein